MEDGSPKSKCQQALLPPKGSWAGLSPPLPASCGSRCPLAPGYLSPIPASILTCPPLCLSHLLFCLWSLMRTLVIGFKPTRIIQDDLISRALSISTKTFSPSKVTFTDSGAWTYLYGATHILLCVRHWVCYCRIKGLCSSGSHLLRQ